MGVPLVGIGQTCIIRRFVAFGDGGANRLLGGASCFDRGFGRHETLGGDFNPSFRGADATLQSQDRVALGPGLLDPLPVLGFRLFLLKMGQVLRRERKTVDVRGQLVTFPLKLR